MMKIAKYIRLFAVSLKNHEPAVKLPVMGIAAVCGMAGICADVPAPARSWLLGGFFAILWLCGLCVMLTPDEE